MGLQLKTRIQGAWAVLTIAGELSADSAAQLRGAAHHLVDVHPLVGLDLIGARIRDAAALAVLTGTHRRARLQASVLVLVATDSAVRAALRAPGLTEDLVVCTSRQFTLWCGGELR